MRAWFGLLAVASLLVAAPAGADDSTWHFESLSVDGKRALLRKLDSTARSSFDVRVVDVGSGEVVDSAALEEMARVPASTIGGKPTEIEKLEWMLASPAFGRDLVRGGAIASMFPFGACGRLAAGGSGSAISFDAGDWLYVADADGRVRRRLVEEAAYDPRFSPDGKWLFFRRATGHDRVLARYEMFVSPTDLSAPPRPIPGTAGMHDHFVTHPDGKTAFAIASPPSGGSGDTCFVSLGLKPPFATKKLSCVPTDGERLVESVISPRGKWASVVTKKRGSADWHLRVVSLATGKTALDESEAPGLALRAISDSGLLVESGPRGVVVHDVTTSAVHELATPVDIESRGYFKSDTELVYETDGSVATLDVTKL